jgi:hypothetical protein
VKWQSTTAIAPDRVVQVAPGGSHWLTDFDERHGPLSDWQQRRGATGRRRRGRAMITVPFPPLLSKDPLHDLPRHAVVERVGALLRKGGYAVGVFSGRRSHPLAPPTYRVGPAGSWSQQRFARRRENQAVKAFGVAAEATAAVLLPVLMTWRLPAAIAPPRRSAERSAARAARSAGSTVWPVAEPQRRVLETFPDQFCSTDPPQPSHLSCRLPSDSRMLANRQNPR